MERLIKLIWDFRGPAALNTAKHHEIHLREFVQIEQLPIEIIGHEAMDEFYAIAYLIVNDAQMVALRDRLKPHRGELYEK